jgi:hypothetical protein
MIVFIIFGALAGGIIGALFVVSALLSHSFSASQAIATTLGAALLYCRQRCSLQM